jgi:uncharacterized protein
MEHKYVRNPFVFGGTVTGDDFCGRESELAELQSDAFSGQNVLVYASRRYGKTSMLEVFRDRCRSEGIKSMYVDVSRALDIADFVHEYFNAFARELGSVERVIETVKNRLGFGLSFSIKPGELPGDITYSLDGGVREKQIPLEQVVNLPFAYAKKENTSLVVMIDEFQETAKLGLEAKLRSFFQPHGRTVSYIFAGSKKSILLQMFGDGGRPFYQSVKTLPINGIPEKDWQPFISKRFASGRKITRGQIRQIVTLARGCPYLVQHLCHVLWDVTDGAIKDRDIAAALDVVLAREDYKYAMAWDALSLTQQKMALVLTDDGRDGLFTKEIMQTYNITPSSAQKALAGLWAKDITDRAEGGRHVFQDPFFKLWLLRRKK